jgi:hypothetical protein
VPLSQWPAPRRAGRCGPGPRLEVWRRGSQAGPGTLRATELQPNSRIARGNTEAALERAHSIRESHESHSSETRILRRRPINFEHYEMDEMGELNSASGDCDPFVGGKCGLALPALPAFASACVVASGAQR